MGPSTPSADIRAGNPPDRTSIRIPSIVRRRPGQQEIPAAVISDSLA